MFFFSPFNISCFISHVCPHLWMLVCLICISKCSSIVCSSVSLLNPFSTKKELVRNWYWFKVGSICEPPQNQFVFPLTREPSERTLHHCVRCHTSQLSQLQALTITMADYIVFLQMFLLALRSYTGVRRRHICAARLDYYRRRLRSRRSSTITPPPTPRRKHDVVKERFWSSKELVPLWNQFSWPRTGSLAVETQRTGSRVGTGSEPAPALPWWKRGTQVLGTVILTFILCTLTQPKPCDLDT